MEPTIQLRSPQIDRPPVPRVAFAMIGCLAVLKLGTHFAVTALTPYEIHRDEFLYLAMGEHLRFWCMDFPPLIAVLAKAARWLFGDSLFAVRFFPAVGGTLTLILTGLLARQLGGGRWPQVLAMIPVLWGPLFLRASTLFQPVVWDQFCWTLGFYALSLVLQGSERRGWIWLGVAGGLGLLTKFSILFFGLGVFVALLLSRQRRVLRTRWPWLAASIALLLGSATIVGQLRLELPVLIHMSDLRSQQLERVTCSEFLVGQLWMFGPGLFLAIAGIAWLIGSQEGRSFRVVGYACITSFVVLMVLHGKPYYVAPIYPTLFAAGAVALAGLPRRYAVFSRSAVAALVILFGTVSLPFGLPILPPEQMARFVERAGGKAAVTTNRGTVLPLPQDYADMLGWEEQVRAVAAAWESVPPEKRKEAGLVARNYGEAGALEFYGPRHRLTRRIMLPDNFQLWPADDTADPVVTIGIKAGDLQRFYKTVKVVRQFDYVWMVEEERNVPLCIAEEPLQPISKAWKRRRQMTNDE